MGGDTQEEASSPRVRVRVWVRGRVWGRGRVRDKSEPLIPVITSDVSLGSWSLPMSQ